MLEKYRIGDLHTYLQQRGIAYCNFPCGRDLKMTDLLNVADPEKSAAVYEKIFGAVAERKNNRIWFQTGRSRIGLLPSPEGQRAGVNHFCVAAAPFNYAAAAKKLEAAGATVERSDDPAAPQFRDPDGFLVQVMSPRRP